MYLTKLKISVDNRIEEIDLVTPTLAGANGVAAGSSLARPRHRWWKGPIQIGCENFHRWRHYLKLVKIP